MTYHKRLTAAILVLCALIGMLVGCTTQDADDDNTLTLNMWAASVPQIMGVLTEKFPDIHFVVNEYAGANNSLYHKELLRRGEGGDIFFYTTFYNDSDAPNYLVDLSGYSFLGNFDRAILSTLDVNGAIYQIPGPISVRYIAVNKTLFEEKGWKIPENFDEMVAVCKQIHDEEPDIAPLGLGMEGMGFIWSLVTSYTQMGFLDTAEGREAEQRFRSGTASFGEMFSEGLDMVGQLVDAGAFMPDRFANTWDVTPRQMGDREAAMCYVMGFNAMHTQLFSGQAKGDAAFGVHNDDEFVILPLYGKNAKNKGLILGTTNTWGINKRLEEAGNEKKLKNALRVLEYISTEEGQLALRFDPATIPAVKNLNARDIPEFMRDLWNDSTNSIRSFFLYTGYEHLMVETGEVLLHAMEKGSSEGMKEEFIRLADQLNHDFLQKQSSSAAFGYAEDDLSVEQTRHISCEALRLAAQTDVAIASEAAIKNGAVNKNGLAGRLFKGDIVKESIHVIVALINTNVVTVRVTGKELRELLMNGKQIPNVDGTEESFPYWAIGVEVSKKQGKITEITLHGNPLDNNAIYTVAMMDRDYSEAFANSHDIRDTGIRVTDALGNYFQTQGTIKADK